jgi:hypothetical protein
VRNTISLQKAQIRTGTSLRTPTRTRTVRVPLPVRSTVTFYWSQRVPLGSRARDYQKRPVASQVPPSRENPISPRRTPPARESRRRSLDPCRCAPADRALQSRGRSERSFDTLQVSTASAARTRPASSNHGSRSPGAAPRLFTLAAQHNGPNTASTRQLNRVSLPHTQAADDLACDGGFFDLPQAVPCASGEASAGCCSSERRRHRPSRARAGPRCFARVAKPVSSARTTSSARSRQPSFRRMRPTCVLAVSGLIAR